jgi:periplasmic divalent cation tolerance protein
MGNPAAVIMTTVAGPEAAARLAGLLVEEHLAACVQEAPITSTYRWEGAVQREAEILLLVKTAADRVPAVVARIQEAHPYTVPEVLVVEASDGAPAYLAWLAGETRPAGS